jgi:hypothetical protein
VLLDNLLFFFGVGTVKNRGSECIQFWVGSLKDLQVIVYVYHFDLAEMVWLSVI